MNALWWLALPVLLLPLWWHRQRRESQRATPLATARFLPAAQPQQRRVWQWIDRILLLLRCLLLATVIAWLADLVLPWRGDTVLLAPGVDTAWAETQIAQAGLGGARRLTLPAVDGLGWLRDHEREWRSGARLMVLGALPMDADRPRFGHVVELRSPPAKAPAPSEQRVAVFSQRPAQWRALFAALDGPRRYRVDSVPSGAAELVIWDLPQTPPAALHAPLWWIGGPALDAFPQLRKAPAAGTLHYADSERGRLWYHPAWPARDADDARDMFSTWQQLHYPPLPFVAPPQQFAASPALVPRAASGALREPLALLLLILLALERGLTHARRR